MAQAPIIPKCHCKYVYYIISWIRNDELIIFTKTREVEFIPAFLISISPSYIVIIAFHLHDRMVWIIIIVHVHWTKLESARIQLKREDKSNMWSQLNKQSCIWEPLNILNMFFYSRPPKKRKEKKTIYTGKLPTSKRRTRNLFGFSF